MAKRWTEEEKELLLKLRAEGLTAKEIALRLPGRTEATVRNLAAKLAPKNTKWTQEEDDLIEQLFLEGISYKLIAKRFPNRTTDAVRSRVSTIITSTGKAPKRKSAYEWSAAKTDLIIQMREEGKTNQEIAEATGVTVSVVSHKVVDLIKSGRVQPRLIHMDWNEEEELALCDLRSQGLSNEQIARQLGRTHPSVALKVSKLITAGLLDPYSDIDRNHPCSLYLVYFIEEGFYKIGITQNSVNTRFNGYPTYKIVEVLTFSNLEEAKKVEAKLLSMIKPFKYKPLVFKYGGATECFQLTTKINSIMDLVAYIEAYENNS